LGEASPYKGYETQSEAATLSHTSCWYMDFA